MQKSYQAEVVIAGGGLAGIVTAFELLDSGRSVLLIEKDAEEHFGGLAKEAFGGLMLVDTPHQRRLGLQDSPELAWSDWERCARFDPEDDWPRRWARRYCEESIPEIFEFLRVHGIRFLPLVNWPERGLAVPLNTIPRWHIAWGTGHRIVELTLARLNAHPRRNRLDILFDHEVAGFDVAGGLIGGIHGRSMIDGSAFTARAEQVVVATGGICGGDLGRLRRSWPKPWGEPPEVLLNGAHEFADGLLHDRVAERGGCLTHLERQWHYAAGIHHPAKRRAFDGLSLVPPRSALWLNARGERILNPGPLVGYTDTRHLVESILQQPGKYSWQVLNRKIAIRELAVSGGDYMKAIRYGRKLRMLRDVLFGNRELVDRLVAECPEDIVTAATIGELVEKMNARSLFGLSVDEASLERAAAEYDAQIDRGPAFFNDDQLRRIMNFRTYRGDRIRTCAFQKILDPKARPLIAIREFILARKSLGGIRTDLGCRVLGRDGLPIPGLYAVGEAAGFGGGGIHGHGSLEGTFLGSCILTGRAAARAIAGG